MIWRYNELSKLPKNSIVYRPKYVYWSIKKVDRVFEIASINHWLEVKVVTLKIILLERSLKGLSNDINSIWIN